MRSSREPFLHQSPTLHFTVSERAPLLPRDGAETFGVTVGFFLISTSATVASYICARVSARVTARATSSGPLTPLMVTWMGCCALPALLAIWSAISDANGPV